MNQPNTLHKVDTIYSSDSIEYLPENQNKGYGIFIVGTYQLIDSKGKFILPKKEGESAGDSEKAIRKGNLQVYKVEQDGKIMNKIHTLDTEASLDIKWRMHPYINDNKKEWMLAQADAKGQIKLFSFEEEEMKLKDKEIIFKFSNAIDEQKENLALSLDWSDRLDTSETKIVSSFSDGSIALMNIDLQNFNANITHRWIAHDLEAWITAFNYFNTNIIYSGADDGLLKIWDTRLIDQYSSNEEVVNVSPIMQNRSHMAGVCSIQSNPFKEHYFVTGSYDEHVRLFDLRNLKRPLKELNVEGGVWRVKWDYNDPNKLLIAAMHNGFHVLNTRLDELSDDMTIDHSFMEHQSLAYGVDWAYNPKLLNEQLVASASFYDHCMCLWSYKK